MSYPSPRTAWTLTLLLTVAYIFSFVDRYILGLLIEPIKADLSLTDEQQQPMMPALRSATVTLPDVNEVIPVHATQAVNFARAPQRIFFNLSLETSIKPGIYRAAVFTKDAYLGSVEFCLRDSFWFF